MVKGGIDDGLESKNQHSKRKGTKNNTYCMYDRNTLTTHVNIYLCIFS